jgi:hypothetical protein
MNVSRSYPVRLFLALATAALVLGIGTATAFGQGASPSNDPSTAGGVSGTGSTGVAVGSATTVSQPGVAVTSGIAAPAWCCGASGVVPGLTTVGQATVDGQDQAARDAAIASAVQDATAQANAAAGAAGIQLGPIIDLQVSAMPYYYPMMGAASGSGTSPGSSGGGSTEPAPAPNMYVGSVSVTITWSLGWISFASRPRWRRVTCVTILRGRRHHPAMTNGTPGPWRPTHGRGLVAATIGASSECPLGQKEDRVMAEKQISPKAPKEAKSKSPKESAVRVSKKKIARKKIAKKRLGGHG